MPPTCADIPTVADFLADATGRLDRVATLLSPRRWEDVDPVAVARELARATAALAAAVQLLADTTPPADPTPPRTPRPPEPGGNVIKTTVHTATDRRSR